MEQIITMEDEDGNEGLRIINATFADPFMLILRDNSSAKLYQASGDGEVEEVEADGLTSTQWLSTSLYKSSASSETYAFLLTHQGGLHVGVDSKRL
jgi:cleavage and polyadenylation specificity factor subunit 1